MTHLNLIFVSSLLHENGQELPDVLERSALHNHSTSVRSMLLFSAGNVMQALDGESADIRHEVKRLFRCADYRQSVVLNEEEVEGPTLTGNSLGAWRLSTAFVDKLPASVVFFSLSEGAVAQRVRLGIARNLLMQFAADYS